MKHINVTKSSMPPFEEYCEEIKELWDSRWLTNMGQKHETLASALREKLCVSNVSLFTNGHLALEAVIRTMHLEGEVITTPYTFASTTHAIVRCGLTPVFCDVKPDDYTMDPEKIEALITPRTCAIMPVHVYGNLCDDEAISAIAEKHGLKVIYDAAHAFAVSRKGKSAAAMGDAAMFSFHATKVFNTIEGGAITYNDNSFTEPLLMQRNFGLAGDNAICVGGNAKMNEFQAAMGLCNLRHIDEAIARRGEVDARYRMHLEGVEGIKLNMIQPDTVRNFAYFPVMFDGFRKNRDEVAQQLAAEGIGARKYFYPLTNAFSCYDYDPSQTPVALHASECVLTLPMYEELSLEDVDFICGIILG